MKDRHACYWASLSQMPIGLLAMTLRGEFAHYNSFEQRVAKGIWFKAIENRPAHVSRSVMEAWIILGNEAINL
jgi:hypothetical protein